MRARLLDRSLPAPFERDVMRPVDRSTLESFGRIDNEVGATGGGMVGRLVVMRARADGAEGTRTAT